MPSSEVSAPLTEGQKYALRLFYALEDTKVKINKSGRDLIWKNFVANRTVDTLKNLETEVPAFFAEVEKATKSKKNLQPAVFSECVYSQALAEKLNLTEFTNHISGEKIEIDHFFPRATELKEFTIRYSYSHVEHDKTLIQAGGAAAVDCALICKEDQQLLKIELKEPYARTSEPDLPRYGEDGALVTSEKFTKKYPQFTNMLNEHLKVGLNVFEHLGNNVGKFDPANIKSAVTSNYSGEKYADVICTEDSNGYLVMLPANHVSRWARLQGEIRPTGRNHYKVWTPVKLQKTLEEIGAKELGQFTIVPLDKLKTSNARGGNRISRYKINPLFFVRSSDIVIEGSNAKFKKNCVRQLIPSITAKMDFDGLDVGEVRNFYEKLTK